MRTSQSLFVGLPVRCIPRDELFGYYDVDSDGCADRHGLKGRAEDLMNVTEKAELGEVAAFCSYSWRDDGPAQLAQLLAWALGQPATLPSGRPQMVWIDRCCLYRGNIELSLACLPIFVAGCKKFLLLAGITCELLWIKLLSLHTLICSKVCASSLALFPSSISC